APAPADYAVRRFGQAVPEPAGRAIAAPPETKGAGLGPAERPGRAGRRLSRGIRRGFPGVDRGSAIADRIRLLGAGPALVGSDRYSRGRPRRISRPVTARCGMTAMPARRTTIAHRARWSRARPTSMGWTGRGR